MYTSYIIRNQNNSFWEVIYLNKNETKSKKLREEILNSKDSDATNFHAFASI